VRLGVVLDFLVKEPAVLVVLAITPVLLTPLQSVGVVVAVVEMQVMLAQLAMDKLVCTAQALCNMVAAHGVRFVLSGPDQLVNSQQLV